MSLVARRLFIGLVTASALAGCDPVPSVDTDREIGTVVHRGMKIGEAIAGARSIGFRCSKNMGESTEGDIACSRNSGSRGFYGCIQRFTLSSDAKQGRVFLVSRSWIACAGL